MPIEEKVVPVHPAIVELDSRWVLMLRADDGRLWTVEYESMFLGTLGSRVNAQLTERREVDGRVEARIGPDAPWITASTSLAMNLEEQKRGG